MSSEEPLYKRPKLCDNGEKEEEDISNKQAEQLEKLLLKLEKTKEELGQVTSMLNDVCGLTMFPSFPRLAVELRQMIYSKMPLMAAARAIRVDEQIYEYFQKYPFSIDKIQVSFNIVDGASKAYPITEHMVEIVIKFNDKREGIHEEIHCVPYSVFFDGMPARRSVNQLAQSHTPKNLSMRYIYSVNRDWSRILMLLQIVKAEYALVKSTFNEDLPFQMDFTGKMLHAPSWLGLDWPDYGDPNSRYYIRYFHMRLLKRWNAYCCPNGIQITSPSVHDQSADFLDLREIKEANELAITALNVSCTLKQLVALRAERLFFTSLRLEVQVELYVHKIQEWIVSPSPFVSSLSVSKLLMPAEEAAKFQRAVKVILEKNPTFKMIDACRFNFKSRKCSTDPSGRCFAIRNSTAQLALFYVDYTMMAISKESYKRVTWPEGSQ